MTPTLEERITFWIDHLAGGGRMGRGDKEGVGDVFCAALAALREKDQEIARLKEALRNSMPIRSPQPGDSYNIEVDKA